MAEVTLRFRHDPVTGKRELVIHYESERDALPHEHERDHRALAEQLLGMPLDDTRIVVERQTKGEGGAEPVEAPEPTAARTPQTQSTG